MCAAYGGKETDKMRIVCSIGLRTGREVVRSLLATTAGAQPELLLLHVIDTGPRRDLEQLAGPLRYGPRGGDAQRNAAIDAEEEAAGRSALTEALAEAQGVGVYVETRLERGTPEQVIVAVAREVHAALVAIGARDHVAGHPFVGPASVGHVAHFVLDHAPCDVLLLRP
jgi:nucleotide-binding universal stress UspA family protein